MKKCRSCVAPVCFGVGVIAAAVLPPKAVCVIAAIVLILTCLRRGR